MRTTLSTVAALTILLLGAGAIPAVNPAAPEPGAGSRQGLIFVSEMQPMPEMDVPGSAHQWSDAEKAKFADDVGLASEEWKKRLPYTTPQQVRSLSRRTKPQVRQYKTVPAWDKESLRPLDTDDRQETLVREGKGTPGGLLRLPAAR